jgi:hypothetical protein
MRRRCRRAEAVEDEEAQVRTTARCGTGASSVVSSHCVQIARRLAWQLGQKYRPLAGQGQQILVSTGGAAVRANPCSDPTGEELVGHLRHHRRHWPAGEAVVTDRLQAVQMIDPTRTSGDAWGRRW